VAMANPREAAIQRLLTLNLENDVGGSVIPAPIDETLLAT